MAYNDPFLDLPPELLQALAEYVTYGDAQDLNLLQLQQAEQAKGTKMPGMIQGRDMMYTPSILEYIAPTIERIQGGQQSDAVQRAIAENIRAKANLTSQKNAFLQQQFKDAADRQAAEQAAAAARAQEGVPNAPQEVVGTLGVGEPVIGDPVVKALRKKPKAQVVNPWANPPPLKLP